MKLIFSKQQKALFGVEKEIFSPRGIRLGELNRIVHTGGGKDSIIVSLPRTTFLSLTVEEFEQIKTEARGLAWRIK